MRLFLLRLPVITVVAVIAVIAVIIPAVGFAQGAEDVADRGRDSAREPGADSGRDTGRDSERDPARDPKGDREGASEGRRLRVLSYNIHHGEGTDGKFDLERIAKVIKATEADIVALQEVDVKTKRASGVDQAAELGRLTGMHHAFGKAIDFSGGEYGQVILSKWKPVKVQTHGLPGSHEGEQRIAVAATIRMGEAGPLIRFVGTHLDHRPDNADRLAQAAKLIELFAKEEADAPPTLVAGDLNAQPTADEIKLLLAKWASAAAAPGMKAQPTYPSDKPRVQIDYILVRPAKSWRVVEVKVIEEKVASDHRPLLAVLELVDSPR